MLGPEMFGRHYSPQKVKEHRIRGIQSAAMSLACRDISPNKAKLGAKSTQNGLILTLINFIFLFRSSLFGVFHLVPSLHSLQSITYSLQYVFLLEISSFFAPSSLRDIYSELEVLR